MRRKPQDRSSEPFQIPTVPPWPPDRTEFPQTTALSFASLARRPFPIPRSTQSRDPYIRYVQANNTVTTFAGEFMGGNHPRFDLSARVDTGGNLVMTGTAAGSPANIQIAAGNLSRGIWSCNPVDTVNGAVKHMGDNDVYSAAVRDVLAGFNYGFIASPEINPNTGKAFGAGPSENWYRSTAPPQSLAFEAAQPGHEGFYNK